VRLERLYRLRFGYEQYWSIGSQNFGLASGRCDDVYELLWEPIAE
jgi:hypothetical protein